MTRPDDLAPWSRRSRRRVYANPWIEVVEDRVVLPTGRETIYGVVRCGEAAGVLPFLDRATVLLVRQWRYVAGRVTWEMPTGGVHAGESVVDAAQRELAEEAGYRAGRLQPMTSFATSKSVVEETAHLFAAYDLEPAEAEPDHTELLRLEAVPFADALDMVLSGEIVDAMTIVAVLWADRRRDQPTG